MNNHKKTIIYSPRWDIDKWPKQRFLITSSKAWINQKSLLFRLCDRTAIKAKELAQCIGA